MVPEERRRAIARQVRTQGSVAVGELSRCYGVTEETIRRDLEELERRGVLQRTYGGAVSVEQRGLEFAVPERASRNLEAKRALANRAIEYIEDGDTLVFDSSSTVLQLARLLPEKKGLTVLTNSLHLACELAFYRVVPVIMIGGKVRSAALSTVGPAAERMLREYNVDKAFVSGNGLSPLAGLTDSNEDEVEIKRLMLASAREVNVLVDDSKVGKVKFTRVAAVEEIDRVFTNSAADDLLPLQEAGVEVIYCGLG